MAQLKKNQRKERIMVSVDLAAHPDVAERYLAAMQVMDNTTYWVVNCLDVGLPIVLSNLDKARKRAGMSKPKTKRKAA